MSTKHGHTEREIYTSPDSQRPSKAARISKGLNDHSLRENPVGQQVYDHPDSAEMPRGDSSGNARSPAPRSEPSNQQASGNTTQAREEDTAVNAPCPDARNHVTEPLIGSDSSNPAANHSSDSTTTCIGDNSEGGVWTYVSHKRGRRGNIRPNYDHYYGPPPPPPHRPDYHRYGAPPPSLAQHPPSLNNQWHNRGYPYRVGAPISLMALPPMRACHFGPNPNAWSHSREQPKPFLSRQRHRESYVPHEFNLHPPNTENKHTHIPNLYITIENTTDSNNSFAMLSKAEILQILNQHLHYETLPDELTDPLDTEFKEAVDKNGGVIPIDLDRCSSDWTLSDSDVLRIHRPKGSNKIGLDIDGTSRGAEGMKRTFGQIKQDKVRVGKFNWVISEREIFTWAVAKHFPKLGGEREATKIKDDILGSHKSIREVQQLGKSGTWKIKFAGENFPPYIDLSRYGRKGLERLLGRVKVCKNCLGFNHLKPECKRDKQTCGNCGQEGVCQVNNCHKHMFCIHCKQDTHRTIDVHACTKYQELKQKHMRQIEHRHDQAAQIDYNMRQIREKSSYFPNPPPFRFSAASFPNLVSDSQKQSERIEQLTKDNENMKKIINDLQTQQRTTKTPTQNSDTLEQTITQTVTKQLQTNDTIKQIVDNGIQMLKDELSKTRAEVHTLEVRLTENTKNFKEQLAALQSALVCARKAKGAKTPSNDTPLTRGLKRRKLLNKISPLRQSCESPLPCEDSHIDFDSKTCKSPLVKPKKADKSNSL